MSRNSIVTRLSVAGTQFPIARLGKARLRVGLFLTPLFIFSIGYLNGQSPDELFHKANEHFQNKEFVEAIEIYESLLADGVRSPDLYFNLGNAYYRNGKLGKAILNYERSLLLKPGFQDARYNLEIAEKDRIDELEILPPFFLKRWWESLRQKASDSSWSAIALIIFWLGIAGLVAWLIAPERRHRKQGFVVGIVLLILSILPLALASSRAAFEKSTGIAIILDEVVSLRSGPDETSAEILSLHDGTEVSLLDKIGNWHKVKLSNGEQGWLPGRSIEEI